jgi:hypothetical protein
MRPATLAEVADRSRVDGDWSHRLDEFLDSFYGAHGERVRQAAMIAQEPALLGLAEADAFLGGVGEHLARRWRLPIPGWVRSDTRYLTRALFVPDSAPFRGYLLAVSPVAFRTRLIFTGPDPLQRARFPREERLPRSPIDAFEVTAPERSPPSSTESGQPPLT